MPLKGWECGKAANNKGQEDLRHEIDEGKEQILTLHQQVFNRCW